MGNEPALCGERRRRPASKASTTCSTASDFRRPIRLLIADDQEVVRVGLRIMCEDEPDLLIVAETGTQAGTLSEAQLVQPDIVILQDRLESGSGFELCRTLCAMIPGARIIILSLENTGTAIRDAVETGAYGYVLAGVNRQELLRAIRAVAEGTFYIDMKANHHLFASLQGKEDAAPLHQRSGLQRVSPQERRILPLLSEGMTNKEISAQLSLSDKTVKNYLSHMFKKLGIANRAQAAVLFVLDQKRTSNSSTTALSTKGNSYHGDYPRR
ncbi:MAG: response regulator transcription factor [Nitrospirae bacterium]|nr:response regulator transcription factor [Nitrospirota bacterium]